MTPNPTHSGVWRPDAPDMAQSDARRLEMYLDHAATTTPRPEALDAMQEVFSSAHANASGQHAAARRAKNALEEARERAADIIGAPRPHDIVFTSGGTESDNLAIIGGALASQRQTIVVSGVEHKAVIESARSLERFGYSLRIAPVDNRGVVWPEAVAGIVDDDTALVSVMAANNEVGTIEPIADIVDEVRSIDSAIPIHTDAVQYFVGRSLDVAALGEHGEQLIDPAEGPTPPASAIAANFQIFLHAQAWEQPAPFRHHGDAHADDLMGVQIADRT